MKDQQLSDENLNDNNSKSDKLNAEDIYNISPPSDVVSFNELRSCFDLFNLYTETQLEIKPDFQRDVVWNNNSKTRFIDSLMKQLPIPSMCIGLDYNTDKRIVIDGLQRISTIIDFLDEKNENWKLAKLDDIDEKISNKTVKEIKEKNKKLFDRVKTFTIPITIIRCDFEKISHKEYLFTIFHRLNTGGNKLNNQEIRNCIYEGTFNNFLKNFVNTNSWKILLNIKPNRIYRFSNEELLLRILAFYSELEKYEGILSKFLNHFMFNKRKITDLELDNYRSLLNNTCDIILKITDNQKLENTNKAFVEALFIGIASNLENLKDMSIPKLKSRYEEFRSLKELSLQNLQEGLLSKQKVLKRINSSINIFA